VRREPARFAELWACLTDDDPLVRMRAADALEKLTRENWSLLAPYKNALLAHSADDGTAEVRWHLVAMMSRLPLSAKEAEAAIIYLDDLLQGDPSRIVRVMALQAAADLSSRYAGLRNAFNAMLERAASSPVPSLRARARKIASSH
jgi:hypothetical protein